jgi:hypothetical protein
MRGKGFIMYSKLFVCSCVLALSGCAENVTELESAASESYRSPSSTTENTSLDPNLNVADGMPDGFIPPTGIATQALVTYINPSTGQTWTAPSGGYTAPDGWVVDQNPVE